ncbi:hypothetical protein FF021_11650 [Leptospira noguchii]|nr:hypothetical protein LEP1GSC073_1512 [Leptospira noguchii str. Cascata]TQE73907.1 hypothetical protein FF021_11650 [Leptospira noguchii]
MISYTLGICKKFKKARDNFEFYKNLRINRSILKKVEIQIYFGKSLSENYKLFMIGSNYTLK